MKKVFVAFFVVVVILMASLAVQAQDDMVTPEPPVVVSVEIIGNNKEVDFNGDVQSVEGFEIKSISEGYTEADFELAEDASQKAEGVEPGTYCMDLKFKNKNDLKFEAYFDVIQGCIIINATPEPEEEPVEETLTEEITEVLTEVEETPAEEIIETPADVEETPAEEITETPVDVEAASAEEIIMTPTVIVPVVETEITEIKPEETATVIVPEIVDEPEAETTPEPTPVDDHVYDTVFVSIKGKQAIVDYDGQKHVVEGYEVTDISNSDYTEGDFMFIGKDYAELTEPGYQPMGLDQSMFVNRNDRFLFVEFNVEDGFIEVSPSSFVEEHEELPEGEETVTKGEEPIDGEETVAKGEELTGGEKTVTEGEELTEGEKTVTEGEELTEGEKTVTEGEELTEGEKTVTEGEELTEGEETVTEGEELTEGEKTVIEGEENVRIETLPAGTIVYLEPTEEAEELITLVEDEQVTVIAVDELGWAELLFSDETTGYVILDDVIKPEKTEVEPIEEKVVTVTVPAGKAIRNGADGMNDVMFNTSAEETVFTVLEVVGNWYKIQIDEETVGYVYRDDAVLNKMTEETEETEQPVVTEAQPEIEKSVEIFTSRRSVVEMGETIEMTSTLTGFTEEELANLTYQWEYDDNDDGEFTAIPGANADKYSYQANEENLTWDWRLTVFF